MTLHVAAPVSPRRAHARLRPTLAAALGCTLLQLPPAAHSNEPAPTTDTNAQTNASVSASPLDNGRRIAWLEDFRHYTWSTTHWLARSIDSWFGDEPFEPNGKVSGQIRINTLWQQYDGFNADVRFRLRADLPNLRQRAYAFIGQDNRNELVADLPAGFTREQRLLRENRRQDQSFFAGLGYAARDDIDFRVGFRGGLKPYVQARYTTNHALSPKDHLQFRQSLFWSARDSLGITAVLDYERALARTLALRWSTVGTLTRRSDGLEWQSSIGLFKQFPHLRSASIETLVEGRTDSVDISNYGLRATWRQPLYRDWLFGKVTLGHYWPKDEPSAFVRERSWALGLNLELHFD